MANSLNRREGQPRSDQAVGRAFNCDLDLVLQDCIDELTDANEGLGFSGIIDVSTTIPAVNIQPSLTKVGRAKAGLGDAALLEKGVKINGASSVTTDDNQAHLTDRQGNTNASNSKVENEKRTPAVNANNDTSRNQPVKTIRHQQNSKPGEEEETGRPATSKTPLITVHQGSKCTVVLQKQPTELANKFNFKETSLATPGDSTRKQSLKDKLNGIKHGVKGTTEAAASMTVEAKASNAVDTRQLSVLRRAPEDILADSSADDVGRRDRTESSLKSVAIDAETAAELKNFCFGSASEPLPDCWLRQGFTFNDNPKLPYTFVPKQPGSWGPSGMLACVQAHFIQHLLFAPNSRQHMSKQSLCLTKLTSEQRSSTMASALSAILWKAGLQQSAVVALRGNKQHLNSCESFKSDGLTECLTLTSFSSIEATTEFLQKNINQFEVDGGGGVVLTLYSAVLSHTIERCRDDMQSVNSNLVSRDTAYCSLELVNLLLTGNAVSNVFNGQQLSSTLLNSSCSTDMTCRTLTNTAAVEVGGQMAKGVASRSDVGFLTITEHGKPPVEVGSYLKTPRYPIWVACLSPDSSKFAVLFSLQSTILTDWKAERKFDLFYCGYWPPATDQQRFEQQHQQQREVRITVDSSRQSFYRTTSKVGDDEDDSCDEPESLVELCLWTKWKHAEINWNDARPI